MYTQSAELYDTIHGSVYDFSSAASTLLALIHDRVSNRTISLLDVACGTGVYLAQLRGHVKGEGLDLSSAMLAIAQERLPDVPFHLGDMADFSLHREFDAVTCLGSSIGHVLTTPRLKQTVKNLARHTRPGGIVVVEPWLTPDVWEPRRVSIRCVDGPAVRIAQLTLSGQKEGISTLDIHYLVGSPSGVEQFDEHHQLGLFTHDEYLAAFRAAGLDVTHDPVGLLGRGLYIGMRGAT
jgi:SAM-dependent methyltransferase